MYISLEMQTIKKKGIKQEEATLNFLLNQLLKATNKEYYTGLYNLIFNYEKVKPNNFLAHILEKYAEINNGVLELNKKEFEEPTNLSIPIDVYYHTQELCRQLAVDRRVPISETDLVLKLQIHMVQTGLVNSAYTKWKWKTTAKRKWNLGKIFFSTAIKEAGVIGKVQGENEFQANNI